MLDLTPRSPLRYGEGREKIPAMNRWRVALTLLLLMTSAAFAQLPDPRDSIILESKTVAAGVSGSPAFAMKVYITNKDTLAILTLALKARTIAGNAYVVLDSMGGWDNGAGWAWNDVVRPLKFTLTNNPAEDFSGYDGGSPDSFLLAATFSPTSQFPRPELPNAIRSAIWELEFMSTSGTLGEIEFDTVRLKWPTGFTIIRNRGQEAMDIPVNFLPGVITVQPLKGDLNLDAKLRPADIVLHLNCVMLGMPPPVGQSYCDLNCDGEATIADVVLELNAVYRKEEFPC